VDASEEGFFTKHMLRNAVGEKWIEEEREKTHPTVTKDSKKIQSTTKVLLNLKNTGMGR
jgi:hypothetical protein